MNRHCIEFAVKTIIDYITYSILRIVGYFARTLDHQEAHDFGAALGRIGMRLFKSRHAIALENLAHALPELTALERERIAGCVFENIGRTIIELARFPLYSAKLIDKMTSFRGADLIESVSARGKGCIFITPHFGNWELVGAWPAAHGQKTSFLVGRQTNVFIDNLLNQLRRSVGVGIIHTGASARRTLGALRRGEFVGFAPDQHSAIGHVLVTFFGRTVAAHMGPVLFAYRTGAEILLCFSVRRGPARHEGWVEGPIHIDRSRPQEEEIQRITQLYFTRFEEAIRKHPEMWMWTHRRWKSLPETEDTVPSSVN